MEEQKKESATSQPPSAPESEPLPPLVDAQKEKTILAQKPEEEHKEVPSEKSAEPPVDASVPFDFPPLPEDLYYGPSCRAWLAAYKNSLPKIHVNKEMQLCNEESDLL